MSSLFLLGSGLSNRINSPAVLTRPIEQMVVGQRVLTDNPTGDVDNSLGEVDARTWRQIVLRLDRPDGTWSELTLIRPEWWLADESGSPPQPGDLYPLDMPEMSCVGDARVVSVAACPPVETGPGPVVTGTFRHSAAEVLELHIEGLAAPIGVTPSHPFWSEDRQAWVAAGELREGERLNSPNTPTQVRFANARADQQATFNLEVAFDHTYRIENAGVLVHNASSKGPRQLILQRLSN